MSPRFRDWLTPNPKRSLFRQIPASRVLIGAACALALALIIDESLRPQARATFAKSTVSGVFMLKRGETWTPSLEYQTTDRTIQRVVTVAVQCDDSRETDPRTLSNLGFVPVRRWIKVSSRFEPAEPQLSPDDSRALRDSAVQFLRQRGLLPASGNVPRNDLSVPDTIAVNAAWLVRWPSLALTAAALLRIAIATRAEVRAARLARNTCPKCGYDLSGNTTGVCPECGTTNLKSQA